MNGYPVLLVTAAVVLPKQKSTVTTMPNARMPLIITLVVIAFGTTDVASSISSHICKLLANIMMKQELRPIPQLRIGGAPWQTL